MKKHLITATIISLAATAALAVGPVRGIFDSHRALPVEKTQPAPRQGNHSRAGQPVFSLGQHKGGTLHEATVPLRQQQAPTRVPGDGTLIYGSMIYSSAWVGSPSYGIYSFPAAAYVKPTLVVPVEAYDANGGATYAGNMYYWNSYVYTDEMGYTFSTFCKYDFTTGTMSKVIHGMLDSDFNQSQITNDLAYDPTTGLIYALSYIEQPLDDEGLITKYYPSLSLVDHDTGFVTPLARIPAMIALAFNHSGELYAISKGQDARLYRVNKETGDCTEIGSTGLNTNYVQSMAFDPVTDRLYWAAVETSGATGLYEVDVTTGNASLTTQFGANEEYAGLYIPNPEVAPEAPAKADNFTATFVADSHTGIVSLNAPTLNYGGTRLSGNMTVTISVDGTERLSKSVAPGEKVELEVTLDEGIHNFTTTVANAAGNGPRLGLSKYVGLDAPAPVTNLKVTKNAAGEAVISWTAPTTGRNDGYVDPAKVRYRVVRFPGIDIIADGISATTVTDPVNVAADNYYYQVTALCDGREGLPAETSPMVLGQGTSLPCKFDFATEEQFKLFTVIDANNDWDAQYHWGGWMYAPSFTYTADEGPAAVYGYSPEGPADDWLITPSFKVQQGKKYRLTYTMWTRGQEEKLEVTAGAQNDIASQSVITPMASYKHKERKVFTQDFTATATGNYHVGFHITSAKKQYYLFITDIMIDEVPDDTAPAAVGSLKAEAGARGDMSATITLTAPTTSMAGTALTVLDRIDIYRGNSVTPCHTFTAPRPGETLTWTDTDPQHGFNTYRVVATAGGKAGAKSEATVFVGYDLPVAPADVKVTVTGDSQPVITWTAPTEGINGGYVNPDELTYAIYRLGDESALLSARVKGTSFTDADLDGNRMQYYVGYEVVPVSAAGQGDYAVTDMIVFGKPYEGVFRESFADMSVSSNPWLMYRIKGNQNLWGIFSAGSSPACSPADGDGGLVTFQSTMGRPGDEGRLVSPKLSVATLKSPVLSFYVYLNASEEALYGDELFQDRLIPEVILPDESVIALGEPILVDNTLGSGWLKYSYDLTDLKGEDYFKLSFHGIADYGQDINLDLIRITNLINNDMRLYSFTGPSAVRAGQSGTYSATVYNGGAQAAAGYTVALYSNGTKIAQQQGSCQSGEYATYEFTVPYSTEQENRSFSLQAVVEWDDDEIPSNNGSELVTTRVTAPVLPEIKTLEGAVEGDNNIRLAWDEPSALRVNDSFEDYTAFGISNIGDYTLVDADKGFTYGFSDIYFPNTGQAQSFMVFNPVSLGIVMKSPLFPDAFDPHTGNQVLACFQAVDATTGQSLKNDDWIISPEVFGGQTVRLYAKAGDVMQGVDQFEVLYSTTDKSTSSFTALSQVISTDQNWTVHEFVLPADARYFAIHCVSDDAFVLYIDDLSYVARCVSSPLELTGYRVYRDGVAIADIAKDTFTYLDTALADGKYSYKVTAVYGGGRESAPTETVEVQIGQSGIDESLAETVKVIATRGTITVTCPDSAKVLIADTAGVTVHAGTGDATVAVTPGIYIVSVDSRVFKVIVR